MSLLSNELVVVSTGQAYKLVGGIRTKAEAVAVLAHINSLDLSDDDYRHVIIGGRS